MISKFDNFIFDLDGTLVDTAPRILECLKEVLLSNDYKKATQNCVSELIGPPLNMMFQSLLPHCKDEEVNELVTQFRTQYNKNPYQNTKSYANAKELLEKLSFSGKRLFVATNKPLVPTQKILDYHFETKFDAIYASDSIPNIKLSKQDMLQKISSDYQLNNQNTLFIGDTNGDLLASRATSIPFAFVLFGYEPHSKDVSEQSDFVIRNYKELL